MNKRHYNNHKNSLGSANSSIVAVAIILAVFSFIVCSNIVNVNAKKSPDIDMKKQYISIEINSGDTLESIAKAYYGPGYSSLKNYIKDIKDVNNMVDDSIYAGGYIIIPQYVAVNTR